MAQPGRRHHQSASIGGRDFWLIPKGEGSEAYPPREQAKPPELLRFDHPDMRVYPEYTYTTLPPDKKRIRLMKLYPGEPSGTKIYCELIEVEYDWQFHIPTRLMSSNADQMDNESSHDSSSSGNGPGVASDEDYRSDLETRNQEKTENKEERLARHKRQAVRNVLKIVDELKKDPEEEMKKEEARSEARFQEWKKVKKNEVQYEALSWCWGNSEEEYTVLIKRDSKTFRKRVRKELALALKYLRRPDRERVLWIDAICIDQSNPDERNHQVQMMSRVYTRARQVCVWLGEADTDSETAIKFIKDEMRELKNFDTISSDEQYSRKWQALMSLMQRDWFFRRWVVQEIALASAATVYCGSHSVPWKLFAVAVELFVEVETATHRLSEVMKRDEKFRHVPGWFEYVSELGASLLVQATGRVFRTKRTPMQPDPNTSDEESMEAVGNYDKNGDEEKRRKKEEDEEQQMRERIRETQTIDPLERRSLLSLEYLVSTMFIFQTSEPRDVAYALLAIARDASPFAPANFGQEDQKLLLVMRLLDRFLAEKPFVVDYTRPYSDVSRDFIEFSIARTHKIDPQQALDILCRPWALDPPRGRSIRLKPTTHEKDYRKKRRLLPARKTWKKRKQLVEKIEDPGNRHFRYRYVANESSWEPDDRKNEQYRKDIEAKDTWTCRCSNSECTHSEESNCTAREWRPSEGWPNMKRKYFPLSEDSDQAVPDINLPSWVARALQAPFMLDHAPGMDMRKTSRANADPLVGSPQDGHRNYSAAGSEKLDLATLKFRKRPVMGHYSLYVKGFELDEVAQVEDASQLGGIPRAWLKLGGWSDLDQDPPDEFWRTIVADRGRDNRNPPYYYARACKESVHKGGHRGGSVNTMALIHDEQNSIVAEFCRRVHAVIWNRCLFKTKRNRLGLATKVKVGDKVCILYGCTVPVILGESEKKIAQYRKEGTLTAEADLKLEAEEDSVEFLKASIRRAVENRERKGKYRPKKREYGAEEWQVMMDARRAYLEDKRRERDVEDTDFGTQAKKAKEKEERKAFWMSRAKEIKNLEEALASAEEREGDGAQQDKEALENEIGKIRKEVEERARNDSKNSHQKSDTEQSTTSNETPTNEPSDAASCKENPDRNYWYEFKGECYLHGMMDGEAMREKFYKSLEDRTFELR